jgi:hypothetical protein
MDVKPNTYWVVVNAVPMGQDVGTVLAVDKVEGNWIYFCPPNEPVLATHIDTFLSACQPMFTDKKEHSDGSTAGYYELPERARQLQDLISIKDMNAQIGEIFRACYRYGEVAHSSKLRDAKKMRFYIEEEIKRLEMYGDE